MNRILLFLSLSILFFSSCMMQKIQYVKNMSPDSIYQIKAAEVLKIQPNDRLSITVHSNNKELSAPFNTNPGGYSLITDSEILKTVNEDNTFDNGYLVDSEGYIEFPVLGRLKVVGLSIDEIETMISNKIKAANYINDAWVKVNLLNFKIMVMGELASNQIISVPDGKITVLEAVIKSGGLTANSNASNVMVIREHNGTRKMIVVDFEKYNVFNSEAYHLQQNDIVYISAKYKSVSPGTQNVWQIVGMLFGVVSLSLTAIAIFARNNGK